MRAGFYDRNEAKRDQVEISIHSCLVLCVVLKTFFNRYVPENINIYNCACICVSE